MKATSRLSPAGPARVLGEWRAGVSWESVPQGTSWTVHFTSLCFQILGQAGNATQGTNTGLAEHWAGVQVCCCHVAGVSVDMAHHCGRLSGPPCEAGFLPVQPSRHVAVLRP